MWTFAPIQGQKGVLVARRLAPSLGATKRTLGEPSCAQPCLTQPSIAMTEISKGGILYLNSMYTHIQGFPRTLFPPLLAKRAGL